MELDEAQWWFNRAEEMRTVAEAMSDKHNKQVALRLADDYERLAKRAEERSRSNKQLRTIGFL